MFFMILTQIVQKKNIFCKIRKNKFKDVYKVCRKILLQREQLANILYKIANEVPLH